MSTSLRVTIDADINPRFTASFLRIANGECAFIESHTAHALPRLLSALKNHGKSPEDVRWVVVTHAHLDHAAGASALLEACPRATLLAHPRAAKNLIEPQALIKSAMSVYGEARFNDLYGKIAPIPKERVRELDDGAQFELGIDKFTVWHTSGHAFHHFIVDDPAMDCVYTGDTFGLIYPDLQKSGLFVLPSTSPTGFNAAEARKSIDKVLSLGREFVCPTHFDVYKDAYSIAAQLRRFIDKAEAWVIEESKSDASTQEIEARLRDNWKRAIADESNRFGEAEFSLLSLDIVLNAQGLAYAAHKLRNS